MMKYVLFTSNFAYNHDQILFALSCASVHPLHTIDPMHFAINEVTRSSYQVKFHF